MSKVIVPIVIITLLLPACSSMSNKEQRMLSGSVMGAGTGLLIGGPVGAIVGGGIGAGGGYAYDQHQKAGGKP